MIMYEYAYRNRKLGAASIPQYQNIDKEHMKEGLQRELISLKDVNKMTEMADLELVYLGEYDDVKMKHIPLDEPELLLICSDYIQLPKVPQEA